MIQRLHELASRQGAVFTRAQALEEGWSDNEIKRQLRRGLWHAVRRGVYTDGTAWHRLDAAERQVLQVHAVRLTCGADLVVSHVSAAVLHGWSVWGIALDEVTVTRQYPQHARREAGVHHFVATLDRDEVVESNGTSVTSPERTMVDLARWYDFEPAVVLCDQALAGGASAEVARALFLRQAEWPGARNALRAIEFADPRSESVGESRLRVLGHAHHLPTATPQALVRSHDGQVIARVDLLFERQRTVGEFDGRVKYALEPNTADPGDVLFKEKLREDAIRETGLEVVRVTWSDLDHPQRTAARFLAAFARAEQRGRRSA